MSDGRTNLQRAIDALLRAEGTTLDKFVADLRADGDSFERIARKLWQVTDGAVEVSGSAIRKWEQQRVEEAAA